MNINHTDALVTELVSVYNSLDGVYRFTDGKAQHIIRSTIRMICDETGLDHVTICPDCHKMHNNFSCPMCGKDSPPRLRWTIRNPAYVYPNDTTLYNFALTLPEMNVRHAATPVPNSDFLMERFGHSFRLYTLKNNQLKSCGLATWGY